MKKMLRRLLVIIVIVGLIFIAYRGITYYIDWNNSWKIEVTIARINVRKTPSPFDSKLGEVNKGQKFRILDQYLEDDGFVWYKIQFRRGVEGWVASDRNSPYVKEINNPYHHTEGDRGREIRYRAPIIKFFEDVHSTLSINTINYNHLEIIGDWDFEITHAVYFEEFPVDRDEPNYWIEYTITDEFGNTDSRIQRIIFQNPPNRSEVGCFSELQARRGR